MSPLNSGQIDLFKRQGFLLLEGLIDPETLSAWRDQFWSHVGADRDDPATWPEDYVIQGFGVDPPLGQLPGMRAIIEQLGGGMFGGGGGSMLVKWPGPEDAAWQMPDSGHIDGYGPGGWSGGFMLGATTYMDDVEPGGGGFVYWPRSHEPVQAYFREHPEQIDGSFRDRADWEERQWGLFSDESPHQPVEFTGRAGDVILWHCFLCHTGSANARARPRLGVFARWHRTDREEMKYDVPEDLWKYWAV